jgi:glycosyltransferase involved in cell wall biosynthesis
MTTCITVIICAHNEARSIAACVHSVLAQSRPPDEVLVINNASTDDQ